MNKKIGILLSVVLLLFIGFGATMYFVSQKIDPKLIKKVAKETIEKALPGANVDIKEIDYSLGTSITLDVKKVKLSLKKDQSKLAGMNELAVKIPLLAIFTSGGTIDVLTKSPELYVQTYKDGKTNWDRAIGKKSVKTKTTDKKVKKKSKTVKADVEIDDQKKSAPAFLKRSQINLRVSNTKLILIDANKKKSELKVSKFILKNIGLKKPTAFEIQTKVDYLLAENNRLKTEAQIVGEVGIKDLIESGKLTLKSRLNVSNTSLTSVKNKIPNVKGSFNLSAAKESADGSVNISIGNVLSISSKLNQRKKTSTLKDIFIEIDFESIKEHLTSEQQKLLGIIEFNDSKLVLKGNAKLVSGRKVQIKPNLTFSMNKDIGLNLQNGMKVLTKLSGSYIGKDVKVVNTSKTFEGTIISEVNTKFDPLNIPKSLDLYSPINVNVELTHLKLKKQELQNILYPKGKKESVKESPLKEASPSSVPVKAAKIILPNIKVKMTGDKIFLGEEVISFDSNLNAHRSKYNYEMNKLNLGKGHVKIVSNGNLFTSQNITSNVNVGISNVNLKTFNALLPPFLSGLEGVFNGSIDGNLKLKDQMKYNFAVKLDGKDGEIKNLNAKQFILPLVEKISALKDKVKDLKVTDKFKLFSVGLNANEKEVDLKKFNIIGNNDSLNISLAGNVSMLATGNSKLLGGFSAKSTDKEVLKYTGKKEIPLMLKGKGFGLIPDSGYTLKKLLSRSSQKKIDEEKKKLTKKVNKQIKKEKKKLENKLKDEAKKLLKGFKF